VRDDDDWMPEDPLEDPLAGTLADIPLVPHHSNLVSSTPFVIRDVNILPKVNPQQTFFTGGRDSDENLESGTPSRDPLKESYDHPPTTLSPTDVKEEEEDFAEDERRMEETVYMDHFQSESPEPEPFTETEIETPPYSFYNSKYTTVARVRCRLGKQGNRGLTDKVRRQIKALPFAFLVVDKLRVPPNKRARVREIRKQKSSLSEETVSDSRSPAQAEPEVESNPDGKEEIGPESKHKHIQLPYPEPLTNSTSTRSGRITRSSTKISRTETFTKDQSEESEKSDDSDWSPPVDELPRSKPRNRKKPRAEPPVAKKVDKVKLKASSKPSATIRKRKTPKKEREKTGSETEMGQEPMSKKVKKVKGSKTTSHIVENARELEPGEVQVIPPVTLDKGEQESSQDSESGSNASDWSAEDDFSETGSEKSTSKKKSKKKKGREGVQDGKKWFQCDFCSKKFDSTGGRWSHQNRCHPEVRDFKCRLCNEELPSYYALRKHRRQAHENDYQACEFCNKKFLLPSLQAHIEISHKGNRRPYKCEDCGHCFSERKKMHMHRESKHGVLWDGAPTAKRIYLQRYAIDITSKYPCGKVI